MKAEIDESGCLTVKAENPLESYALSQWHKGWNKPVGEMASVLLIEVPVEGLPGMTRTERAMPVTGVLDDQTTVGRREKD